MKNVHSINRAFTIIELLVVIAIIAMLAAILFPVLSRAKESGYLTQSISNAKQLGLALKMYSDAHDDAFLPSTNYGSDTTDPSRMWQTALESTVKSKDVFVAPNSEGSFASNWEDRGQMSFGYSSATALDTQSGCATDKTDESGCTAFTEVANGSKLHEPAATALLAVTPNGDTAKNYRGYEFSPYNGTPNDEHLAYSPPLVSDRDLVKELTTLPADALKPVYCRYMKTDSDDGMTPVVFADGHAKSYSAKEISDSTQKIVWRFR
jgi:prepilin-type N-terminal cleavage/methylation domain-containing protein